MVAALLVVGDVSAVGAASLGGYGWWHKAQQLPGTNLPTPPGTPAEGIVVANDPTGPFAIGGVHFVDAHGPATLTLSLADGGEGGTPTVVACPVTSAFDGTVNGRWEQRPTYDCAKSAAGKLSADGAAIAFQLGIDLQRVEGQYTVALVPAAGSQPFTIAFDRPTDASLVVTSTAGGDTSVFPSEPAYEPAPASDFGFSGDTGRALAPDALGDSPTAAPLAPVGPTPPSSVTARPSSPIRTPEDRDERLAAALTLLAMGFAAWWFGSQPSRAPRLLGSLGAKQQRVVVPGRVGGIGRFARPRAGGPTRL